MKRFACVLLVLTMAFLHAACGEKTVDYDYASLAAVMEHAEGLQSCRVKCTTEMDILQGSKTELSATQKADLAYALDENGEISELYGTQSLQSGNDEEAFSVYYADGIAYYEEEDRRHMSALSSEVMAAEELFLFFEETEIEDYRAVETDGGCVKVTFSVPWESISPKVNALYDQLAAVLQASGLDYKEDLTYRDVRAEYIVYPETNMLASYTYTYGAQMTVDGTAVKVTGKTSCTIVQAGNVSVYRPYLSLWN